MGEYYFKSVGVFSVGAFYKGLQDFIYPYADNSYNSAKFARDFPDIANPVPAGENWDFIRPMNGESVSPYGFEAAFQRKLDFFASPFLRNFSVYLSGSDDVLVRINPGTVDNDMPDEPQALNISDTRDSMPVVGVWFIVPTRDIDAGHSELTRFQCEQTHRFANRGSAHSHNGRDLRHE